MHLPATASLFPMYSVCRYPVYPSWPIIFCIYSIYTTLFLFSNTVNCITLFPTGIYPAVPEAKKARAKIVAECKVSMHKVEIGLC